MTDRRMISPDFLSRFTTHLKEALQKALAFALNQGRVCVDSGDILVGMIREKGCIAAELLARAGIKEPSALHAFSGSPDASIAGDTVAPDLSPAVRSLLEKSVLLAHVHEHKYIGTEHLLAALLESDLPDIKTFFQAQGIHLPLLREQVDAILKSSSKFPDIGGHPEEAAIQNDEGLPTLSPEASGRGQKEKRPSALEVFAHDLTSPEQTKQLDPVIGRDMIMDRVIEILCRRTKNNPILLGEPGVGKTAIVEGLAQRLVLGDVPDLLIGKRLLAVDLALMVAGTMYRGEFEARLKQVVEEAKNDTNIILFIDEIHNIVGAGSTSGSLDAANILKPALARGDIRCIGATTWSEYKKHIEPDAALERRYQSVDVPEPSAQETRSMLEGLKARYEDHHGVRFGAHVLDQVVALAGRYLTDRFFPDKAIDLLDEAAAHVSAQRKSGELIERFRAVDAALASVRAKKADAIEHGALADASKSAKEEQRLATERAHLEKTLQKHRQQNRKLVSLSHVAQIVARQSRVPVETILLQESTRLSSMQDRLGKAILGQPRAVQDVSEILLRAQLGFSDPQRPKASLLFVGPSGTGKTAIARTIAQELFGREDALIKFDMSEFSESHSVAKLLGSPAGYVGFREQNRLSDAIRKRPHAVLLFDEFEKAHPDIQHLLLQALEDGVMTDATGRSVSLRHAYILLTSNAGSDLVNRSSLGFGSTTSDADRFDQFVRTSLKERFRPELLNRLDRIIVFRPLEQAVIKQIVRRELDAVLARASALRNVVWTATQEVVDWLVDDTYPSEEGARAARKMVEREFVSLMSQYVLDHPRGKTGIIKVEKGKLKVVVKK